MKRKRQRTNGSARRNRTTRLVLESLEERLLMTVTAVEPTNFEQYVLELVNRARAFPNAEVAKANAYVAGNAFPSMVDWTGTPDLNEGLPAGTISAEPKQPLAFNLFANHAARDYSEQLLAGDKFGHNEFGHEGVGTATPSARVTDAGVTASVAENIGYHASSATYVIDQYSAGESHFGLFIDRGYPGRGHRIGLLDNAYREVGIGLASDTTYEPNGPGCCPNAVLVTQDFFSRSGFVYLTGVAYNETVANNNFYDPGEGLSSVTITATPMGGGGASMTTTFGSGGYSLQLADGTYTITATGTAESRVVTINGANVKLDIVDGQMITPLQPSGGLFHNGRFYLDTTSNDQWDSAAAGDTFSNFGLKGIASIATPVVGDWNGDGADDLGLYNNGRFYLDATDNNKWDSVVGGDTFSNFGLNGIASTAIPVVGDWDGDGTDDIGLYNNGRFYLDSSGNGSWDGAGTDTFSNFGLSAITSTALPVVGDWDGDGTDDLGLYNNGRFYLDTSGNAKWDSAATGDTFSNFGLSSITATALPLIGDWEGDVTDNVGLYNNGRFYLDTNGNNQWDSVASGDTFGNFGLSAIAAMSTPLVGHWHTDLTPLFAAGGLAVGGTQENLTYDALTPIVDQAIAFWQASGLTQAQLQSLASVQVRIADLPGARLGEAQGATITLDINAAGYGWFVDATPGSNEEFHETSQGLVADASGPAAGRMDLLTAVLHELGHVLGHGDLDDILSDEVMSGWLAVGVRKVS